MRRRIGAERYELEHRLGHGGMATVYRARDLKLERQVAIKLLADNFAGDEEVRRRFAREARLAARLDHPNVVQVFDVGEDDDRPYIVMEHVEGGTLADRLSRRRRSLDRSEALRLLGQLCEGLGHAHSKKLVHRDIKPQNLLLRASDDCLKITDFGIARAAEETTRLTRPGKVIGTDHYMAPEQLADGKITPATDVYACGVVADELLPDARSPELSEIIERCLREDPDERFADAERTGRSARHRRRQRCGWRRPADQVAVAPGPTKRLPTTGGATSRWPAPTDVLPRDRRRWTRLAAGLALIAAVAAGAVIALSGGSDSAVEAEAGAADASSGRLRSAVGRSGAAGEGARGLPTGAVPSGTGDRPALGSRLRSGCGRRPGRLGGRRRRCGLGRCGRRGRRGGGRVNGGLGLLAAARRGQRGQRRRPEHERPQPPPSRLSLGAHRRDGNQPGGVSGIRPRPGDSGPPSPRSSWSRARGRRGSQRSPRGARPRP